MIDGGRFNIGYDANELIWIYGCEAWPFDELQIHTASALPGGQTDWTRASIIPCNSGQNRFQFNAIGSHGSDTPMIVIHPVRLDSPLITPVDEPDDS